MIDKMIDIVYFSNVTENTHKFVQKLDVPNAYRIPIKGEFEYDILRPFILITPTYGTGKKLKEMVPHQVRKFLQEKDFTSRLSGVIAGGNLNFGDEYGMAGDIISYRLKVPLLYKFELAGTTIDVEKVQQGLQRYCSQPNT